MIYLCLMELDNHPTGRLYPNLQVVLLSNIIWVSLHVIMKLCFFNLPNFLFVCFKVYNIRNRDKCRVVDKKKEICCKVWWQWLSRWTRFNNFWGILACRDASSDDFQLELHGEGTKRWCLEQDYCMIMYISLFKINFSSSNFCGGIHLPIFQN